MDDNHDGRLHFRFNPEDEETIRLVILSALRFAGVENDIQLSGKNSHFTGYATGRSPEEYDALRIICYDISEEGSHLLGAMHLTREQWEELKSTGDALLAPMNDDESL